MTSLYEKIRELEAVYNIQEKEKLDPLIHLKLTFPKKYDDREKFLEEFKDFDFKFLQEHFDGYSYYSVEMENSLANKLKKIIDSKVQKIRANNFINPNFDACIEKYNNNITTYLEHKKPSVPDTEMLHYYQKSFEFEERVLNTNFKNDFCNEFVKVLDDCLNYKKLIPKFETKDPLLSLVFEIYTTFEKLYYKNILDSHSMHYPYLYMFDVKDNYKILKELNDKKYYLNLEKVVKDSLKNKFDGLDSIVNTKDFKNMINFKSELDLHQFSAEDQDHINSYISKDTLDYRQVKLVNALIAVIYKTVIESVSVQNAKALNDIFTKENESEKIKIAFTEYLSDRFDLNDQTSISDLISGSEPLYKSKKTKQKIKNSG
jgi:hypothetical protein